MDAINDLIQEVWGQDEIPRADRHYLVHDLEQVYPQVSGQLVLERVCRILQEDHLKNDLIEELMKDPAGHAWEERDEALKDVVLQVFNAGNVLDLDGLLIFDH